LLAADVISLWEQVFNLQIEDFKTQAQFEEKKEEVIVTKKDTAAGLFDDDYDPYDESFSNFGSRSPWTSSSFLDSPIGLDIETKDNNDNNDNNEKEKEKIEEVNEDKENIGEEDLSNINTTPPLFYPTYVALIENRSVLSMRLLSRIVDGFPFDQDPQTRIILQSQGTTTYELKECLNAISTLTKIPLDPITENLFRFCQEQEIINSYSEFLKSICFFFSFLFFSFFFSNRKLLMLFISLVIPLKQHVQNLFPYLFTRSREIVLLLITEKFQVEHKLEDQNVPFYSFIWESARYCLFILFNWDIILFFSSFFYFFFLTSLRKTRKKKNQ